MDALVVQETASAPHKSKFIAWIPTLLWLAMIAYFSTDTFSATHTRSILERILRAIHLNLSADQFAVIHHFIRKAAHFSVYGLLSVFAYHSWRITLPRRARWTFTWSGLAVLLAFVAGSLDELHQIFVPSRGPSPYDVMLDTMGALFVQILIASFVRMPSPTPRAGPLVNK